MKFLLTKKGRFSIAPGNRSMPNDDLCFSSCKERVKGEFPDSVSPSFPFMRQCNRFQCATLNPTSHRCVIHAQATGDLTHGQQFVRRTYLAHSLLPLRNSLCLFVLSALSHR